VPAKVELEIVWLIYGSPLTIQPLMHRQLEIVWCPEPETLVLAVFIVTTVRIVIVVFMYPPDAQVQREFVETEMLVLILMA
jgi:hypothetical protein